MNINLISPDSNNGSKYLVKFRDPITVKKNSKIYLNYAKFTRGINISLNKDNTPNVFFNTQKKDKKSKIFPPLPYDATPLADKKPIEFNYNGIISLDDATYFTFAKELERVYNEAIRNNKNIMYYYRPSQTNFNVKDQLNFTMGFYLGNNTSEGNFRRSSWHDSIFSNDSITQEDYTSLKGNMDSGPITLTFPSGSEKPYYPDIYRNIAASADNEFNAYSVSIEKYFHWEYAIRNSELTQQVDSLDLNKASAEDIDAFLNSNYIEFRLYGSGVFYPQKNNTSNPLNTDDMIPSIQANLVGSVMIGLIPYEWAQLQQKAGKMGDGVVPDPSLYSTPGAGDNIPRFKVPIQIVFNTNEIYLVAQYPTGKDSLSDYENPVTDEPDLSNYKVLFSLKDISDSPIDYSSHGYDFTKDTKFRFFTYVKKFNFTEKVDCVDALSEDNFIKYKSPIHVNNIEYKVGNKLKIYYEDEKGQNNKLSTKINSIDEEGMTLSDTFPSDATQIYFEQILVEPRVFLALQFLNEFKRWITLYETNENSEDYFKYSYFKNDSNNLELRSQIPWSIITSATEEKEGFLSITYAGFDQNNQKGSGSTPEKPICILEDYSVKFDEEMSEIIGLGKQTKIIPNVSTSHFNQEKYFVTLTLQSLVDEKTYSIYINNLPIGNYKNSKGNSNGGYMKPILKNCPLPPLPNTSQILVRQTYEPKLKEIFSMKNQKLNINHFDIEIRDSNTDKLSEEVFATEINFTIIDSNEE